MSNTSLDAVRASLIVAHPVDRTFERFVREFGRWWPQGWRLILACFAREAAR